MHYIQYDIKTIKEIVKGEFVNPDVDDYFIKELLIDSRKLASPIDTLFFAIKGSHNNAHLYIPELYEAGVRNFIVSDKPGDISNYHHANFIEVENTLEALQNIAAAHRLLFNYPVVGITGSNGKTIVKEWLYQLLKDEKNIVRSPKSYNSQVGVPLSVWQMHADNNLALFEAGISKVGEMQKLENIIKPTIGIFTNIGEAHSENFKSIEQKVEEKLVLFKECKQLIYCKDYSAIHQAIKSTTEHSKAETFTWSKKVNADLLISRINKGDFNTNLQAIYKNSFIEITIPFIDDASIENAITCWCFCLMIDIDPEYIAHQMEFLSPVAMRLELKEGVNNCSIINDSYNSDFGSLQIALDFLVQQKQHAKRTLILSDILQSGKDEEQLYKQISQLLRQKNIQRLIGIGEAITRQQDLFELEKYLYPNTASFISAFKIGQFRDETILLKGARSFGFEEISKHLQQKAHETILEINLNALIHNINYYRSLIKPNTRMMAMVKAFSYGSGSFEIANVLQFHRVDYLSVAYADEGVELRKAGIMLPIMVMNPEEQSFDAILDYNLEPDIYCFRVLQQFSEALGRHELNEPVNIHVELDTGMHRLGFEKEDLNELIIRIKNNKNIRIRSIFSHFVGSDEHSLDYYTHKQIKDFDTMSGQILSHFNYPILRHLANSAGITRFPEAQFDMVRLGIGLYGITSNEAEQRKIQNVSTLKTTISQIKNIKAGDTIGYNRRGVAEKDTRIATIPIGYADGLNRKLSNGIGNVMINGKSAPIIGNICMDMCMVNISDIQANEGDEVIVFGDNHPIYNIAEAAGTIPYEILTSVSRRVKRVYFQE